VHTFIFISYLILTEKPRETTFLQGMLQEQREKLEQHHQQSAEKKEVDEKVERWLASNSGIYIYYF